MGVERSKLYVVFLLFCLFGDFQTSISLNSKDSSLLFQEKPFKLQVYVNVILAGFTEDENSIKRFENLLSLFSSRSPFSWESEEELCIQFDIIYRIVLFSVEEYENLLKIEMKKGTLNSVNIYVIPITSIFEQFFDKFLEDVKKKDYFSIGNKFNIFIMNPNKNNIGLPSSISKYAFSYENSIHLTRGWIGHSNYVVIDLTANPTLLGSSHIRDGGISFIGQLQKSTSQIQFESEITAIITSAVRHVFLPDIRYDSISHPKKILIPLVILKNHNDFNPLEREIDYSINYQLISKTLKEFLPKGQDVLVVPGVHSLHEHKHLSVVVAKAKKSSSIYGVDAFGNYLPQWKPYIDSYILLQELKNVGDLLGSGLIGLSSMERSIFFNPNIPQHLLIDQQNFPSKGFEYSQGTRILPVYVLSLVEQEELLFDHKSLFVISKEAVVVLQTNFTSIPIPYFADTEQVHLFPRNPTKSILEGIIQVLTGLVNPYESYSPTLKSISKEFLWSFGPHPFGIFSNNTKISSFFLSLSLRNCIISRINVSFRIVKKALIEIDKFSKEYLLNPFDTEHEANENIWFQIIDGVYSNASILQSLNSLPIITLYNLKQEIQKIEKQFALVKSLLQSNDLVNAYNITSNLEATSIAFYSYVVNQLDNSKNELLCCVLQTEVIHPSSFSSFFPKLFFFFLLILVIFRVFSFLKESLKK